MGKISQEITKDESEKISKAGEKRLPKRTINARKRG